MRLRSTLILTALLALYGCERETPTPDAGGNDASTMRPDGSTTQPDSGDDTCIPTPENTEAACSDGIDNDCDGFIDCNDFDCCDHRTDCGAETSCGQRNPVCDGPRRDENTLDACTNGCDDDQNGHFDCGDFGCCSIIATAVARGVPGVEACAASTPCGMQGSVPLCDDDDLTGRPQVENSFELCSDGCSNDRTKHFDCENFGCCAILERAIEQGVPGAVECGAETACKKSWDGEPIAFCDDDDGTGPPQVENSFELCSDGCSNARTKFFDCENFGCCAIIERAIERGVAGAFECGAASACKTTWNGQPIAFCDDDDGTGQPAAENTVEACSNDCDDDRDGFTDCDDRKCCGVRTDCPSDTYCGRQAS